MGAIATLSFSSDPRATYRRAVNTSDLLLWAGSRLPAGLDERLAFSQAGGMTSMSMFPLDVRRAARAGTPAIDLAARARDGGVPITVLDPYTRWLPRWQPPSGLSPADLDFLDVEEDEFFAMAADLGVSSVSVIEPFGAPLTTEEATAAFARTCDRAADDGLRVHLEFLPWSSVPDLRTGWDVVRDADRPNGGLVLDSWHFFRSGSTLEQLRQVPGDRIFVVQLSDGPATASADLAAESAAGRLLPGDGAWDLPALLDVLADRGGLTSVGPEVFSPSFWSLPTEQAGAAAGDAVRALLAGR
jgi:sugar phosphate isomerase/epimerase